MPYLKVYSLRCRAKENKSYINHSVNQVIHWTVTFSPIVPISEKGWEGLCLKK